MVVVTSYVSYRNLEATFWHRSLPDTICNIRRRFILRITDRKREDKKVQTE